MTTEKILIVLPPQIFVLAINKQRNELVFPIIPICNSRTALFFISDELLNIFNVMSERVYSKIPVERTKHTQSAYQHGQSAPRFPGIVCEA